ncbi:MAG: transposase [Deltaproteobacteria bacterium]|nr:transposase [Deltaproteobacteria bacterium]
MFMEQVAERYRGPVVILWDNLNVHYDGRAQRWTRYNARHDNRFTFAHTPKHASWVNQVVVLQRRVPRNGSFGSVQAFEERTLGDIAHWNDHEGHPFNWTFRGTRDLRSRRDHGPHARCIHRPQESREHDRAPPAALRTHAPARSKERLDALVVCQVRRLNPAFRRAFFGVHP